MGDAARQRGTPAARSKRAAEKAAAASPESTSHPAAATPAAAPAAASRGSPRPAEPPTTPMETDEKHAAPPPTAAASAAGGAALVSSAAADLVNCPICTPKPKSQVLTLACRHPTCGECMLKMRSAYTEQTDRIDLTYDTGAASDGTLAPPTCPTCRGPISEAEFAAAEAIVAAVPATPTLESAGNLTL